MSRRKKSHQSHGTANRPRLWGKHAVAAALDNPARLTFTVPPEAIEGSPKMILKIYPSTFSQIVVCQLEPGQTMICEAGKFLWKSVNVGLETRFTTPEQEEASQFRCEGLDFDAQG